MLRTLQSALPLPGIAMAMNTGVDDDFVVFHRIDNEVWESVQRCAPRILSDLRVGEREARYHIQGGI